MITDDGGEEHRHTFPRRTLLYVKDGDAIAMGTPLNEGSLYPHEILSHGAEDQESRRTETELYFVREVQEVYKSQGVDINDKHIELIVRQMMKKVRVDQKGDTDLLPGLFVDRHEYKRINQAVIDAGGEPAQSEEIILGITKASLNTDSFLSAASFQETTKVLTDAALEGKIDRLNGLKENVIIGKLIPAATGLKRYRRIEIEPAEPLPRGIDEVGLLDHDDLAAELGLADGDALGGFGGIEADLSDLEEIGRDAGHSGSSMSSATSICRRSRTTSPNSEVRHSPAARSPAGRPGLCACVRRLRRGERRAPACRLHEAEDREHRDRHEVRPVCGRVGMIAPGPQQGDTCSSEFREVAPEVEDDADEQAEHQRAARAPEDRERGEDDKRQQRMAVRPMGPRRPPIDPQVLGNVVQIDQHRAAEHAESEPRVRDPRERREHEQAGHQVRRLIEEPFADDAARRVPQRLIGGEQDQRDDEDLARPRPGGSLGHPYPRDMA